MLDKHVREALERAIINAKDRIAKCDKCGETKKTQIFVISNRHAKTAKVLCEDCYEDYKTENEFLEPDEDELEGGFMGA